MAAATKLAAKVARSRKKDEQLIARLGITRQEEEQAVKLASEIAMLMQWLR